MNMQMTEREQEVLRLHEDERLSFRVIAERYGISPGRASQVYRDADRKRRHAYQVELQREENKKEISLVLTRGELLMLWDILGEYVHLATNNIRHTRDELNRLESDPRYQEAERLRELFYSKITGKKP